MAGTKGQKKRFWSDEEKRSICLQTRASGVSVAQVERRYSMNSMNSNLLFTWLRDPRFSPTGAKSPEAVEDSRTFLPVEISASATTSHLTNDVVGTHRPADTQPLAQRVDITLSDGRRILVAGWAFLLFSLFSGARQQQALSPPDVMPKKRQ